MKKPKTPKRLNFVVRQGSELERFLTSNTNRTASAALHELAAAYRALKEK